jgi:serine/threonine protein kinase
MVQVTGTPLYMAPENLRGCHGIEVDVWAAGVMVRRGWTSLLYLVAAASTRLDMHSCLLRTAAQACNSRYHYLSCSVGAVLIVMLAC